MLIQTLDLQNILDIYNRHKNTPAYMTKNGEFKLRTDVIGLSEIYDIRFNPKSNEYKAARALIRKAFTEVIDAGKTMTQRFPSGNAQAYRLSPDAITTIKNHISNGEGVIDLNDTHEPDYISSEEINCPLPKPLPEKGQLPTKEQILLYASGCNNFRGFMDYYSDAWSVWTMYYGTGVDLMDAMRENWQESPRPTDNLTDMGKTRKESHFKTRFPYHAAALLNILTREGKPDTFSVHEGIDIFGMGKGLCPFSFNLLLMEMAHLGATFDPYCEKHNHACFRISDTQFYDNLHQVCAEAGIIK